MDYRYRVCVDLPTVGGETYTFIHGARVLNWADAVDLAQSIDGAHIDQFSIHTWPCWKRVCFDQRERCPSLPSSLSSTR